MDEARLEYLFERYVGGTADAGEKLEFLQLAELPENRGRLEALLDAFIKKTKPESEPSDVAEEAILQAIFQAKPRVVPMFKRRMVQWVAAAVVLFVACSVWFVVSRKPADGGPRPVATTHDVAAPKETRAVITLADGTKVYLDSVNTGTIAQQSNVNVIKDEKGEIIYSHEGTKTQTEVAYNTMFNPRGSKVISLTLSDGTRVWLNSESSLKYPTAFTGNSREVEITGEAYFEVRHNSAQSFKVHLPNGSVVEDIGTSFNVNAYVDETDIKTTLIEGSVKVVGDAALNTNNGVVLKPGQQAIVSRDPSTPLRVTNDVDIDQVVAWRNGFFQFDHTDTKSMLRQLARWYDVDVRYEGVISSRQFGGRINREMSLAEVLGMLKSSGVNFKIEGKELIVMP